MAKPNTDIRVSADITYHPELYRFLAWLQETHPHISLKPWQMRVAAHVLARPVGDGKSTILQTLLEFHQNYSDWTPEEITDPNIRRKILRRAINSAELEHAEGEA